MEPSFSVKKFSLNALRGLIAVVAFYIIYQMIRSRLGTDSGDFIKIFREPRTYLVLFLVFILMLANWLIEALKWRFLVAKVETLNLKKSLESLLAGLNLAIYTPARVGEYGGRILYLKPENRKRGALCVLVGNLSQMVVTVVFGLIGTFFWLRTFAKISSTYLNLIGVLLVLLAIGFLMVYYRIKFLSKLLTRLGFLDQKISSFKVLADFSQSELHISLIFSVLRYLIFSNQYILLLFGLMGPQGYLITLASMAVIFMAQSIIPSFVFADMGIRGATSSFFLSFVFGKQNIIPILASAFYVWILNIILPATIGIFFVLKIKKPFGRP